MLSKKTPAYDLRTATREEVLPLFEKHHGYKSLGKSCTYIFAVYEEGKVVAAFVWQPPPLGASKSVCEEQPAGVLALSRMVAIPHTERKLRHISKPLRRQMRLMIDRGRWPVLVTYHDEGQGHTGHVYKCSGWWESIRRKTAVFEDGSGRRVSRYSGGRTQTRPDLVRRGYTFIQRWEHWACPLGSVSSHMAARGWSREAIPDKCWRSGNQAHKWVGSKVCIGPLCSRPDCRYKELWGRFKDRNGK